MRFPGGWKGYLGLTAISHALLAAWVATDARRHGARPGPWTLATLGGGFFGVFAWLLRRRSCPSC